jgi:hypothetical protein
MTNDTAEVVPTPEDVAEWEAWLVEHCEVAELAARFSPWKRFRLKTTGQRCQPIAFGEDGTLRVRTESLLLGVVDVFGIDPADVEDLNSPVAGPEATS